LSNQIKKKNFFEFKEENPINLIQYNTIQKKERKKRLEGMS
jgi:uncharacterized protein YjiK